MESIDRFKALYRALAEDHAQAELQRAQDDSGYNRRNSIRLLFALIEGVTFAMKQIVIELVEGVEQEFYVGKLINTGERAILHEEEYFLDKSGKVKSGSWYRDTLADLIGRCNEKVAKHSRGE